MMIASVCSVRWEPAGKIVLSQMYMLMYQEKQLSSTQLLSCLFLGKVKCFEGYLKKVKKIFVEIWVSHYYALFSLRETETTLISQKNHKHILLNKK